MLIIIIQYSQWTSLSNPIQQLPKSLTKIFPIDNLLFQFSCPTLNTINRIVINNISRLQQCLRNESKNVFGSKLSKNQLQLSCAFATNAKDVWPDRFWAFPVQMKWRLIRPFNWLVIQQGWGRKWSCLVWPLSIPIGEWDISFLYEIFKYWAY